MTDGVAPDAGGSAGTQSRVLSGMMPDITAAQLVGIVTAVLAVAVSFGASISREQQEAILAVTGAVVAVLFGADAHLRTNRAHASAVKHAADVHATSVSEALDHHKELAAAAAAANQPAPPLVFPPPVSVPER